MLSTIFCAGKANKLSKHVSVDSMLKNYMSHPWILEVLGLCWKTATALVKDAQSFVLVRKKSKNVKRKEPSAGGNEVTLGCSGEWKQTSNRIVISLPWRLFLIEVSVQTLSTDGVIYCWTRSSELEKNRRAGSLDDGVGAVQVVLAEPLHQG